MNNYLIDTPPPTISGSLHIGHIFSYTQGDIFARYRKYKGVDLVYPFCFDNNGIPTGKLAANKNIKGTQNIIDFSVIKGSEYKEIFNLAGIQFAENQSYNTYDSNAIQLAYSAFELLKSNGIAYKAVTEYLWSEKLQSSISQSELTDGGIIERTGEYPIVKIGEGWFINIKDHLKAIKQMIDSISWNPIESKLRIDNWLNEITYDWSISRNRNFGIPIPGETDMTFDTWFISALSPQMAYTAYTGIAELKCPTFDLRYQSHDIIRTWAFYTIAMSYFLNNQIPWKSIIITGHTLDGSGNKFSKSNGNATNPIPLINKYHPNGIRHWAASNVLGTDLQIDEEKMKMGWRIANKFTNAKKFIQMQIDNEFVGENEQLFDEWLIVKNEIIEAFEAFNLFRVTELMYKFMWNTFCDVWIEESKKNSTALTLQKIAIDFEPLFNIIYGN